MKFECKQAKQRWYIEDAIVGILKGFAGLTGAIVTQIYDMFNAPDESSLILMLAVGPPLVEIALMFIVRPISGGHKQVRPSDNTSFYLIYAFCISLAAYLLAVAVIDDTVDVNQTVNTLIAVILILILLLPVIIPVVLVFCSTSKYPIEESLLDKPNKQADDEDGGGHSKQHLKDVKELLTCNRKWSKQQHKEHVEERTSLCFRLSKRLIFCCCSSPSSWQLGLV
ncbi:hypothetical protein Dsin_021129 [Dipteronia sinensis]|uniref:Nodulin-like domain-containing protein n=1 Tax=Dipteronia sinensis TaxID=43782 RepID=A0AAE0ABP4_9ROSI|nr:hypothetical protein Dsin_021129 [Dipteronia sinensis]